MNGYAIHNDEAQLELALKQARGSYQRNILLGNEAISGGTLTGKARDYTDRYRRSSAALIARCQAAGVKVSEVVGDHNKRILVIG